MYKMIYTLRNGNKTFSRRFDTWKELVDFRMDIADDLYDFEVWKHVCSKAWQ